MSWRRVLRPTAGWAFGLATSILFISLWGRAVVVDTEALADSLVPMARSALIADRVSGWMALELSEAGVDQVVAEDAVTAAMERPAFAGAVESLIRELVTAAASPGGSSVEVAAALRPAIPDMVSVLAEAGLEVGPDRVEAAVAGLDPIPVGAPGAAPHLGPGSPVASRLGIAAVAAIAVMLLAATLFVWAESSDRVRAARELLSRVALGGLSFALLLRLGGWILDPGGGRAPLGSTLSALAGSKWAVPMLVAGIAGTAAGGLWLVRRRVKQGGATRWRSGDPTPPPELQPSP